MTVQIEISDRFGVDSGLPAITIEEDEIDSTGYRATKTHTGFGDLRATITTSTDLIPYAQLKSRLDLRIDGEVEWSGYLISPGKEQTNGKTRIKAYGVGSRLEETRPNYETLSNDELTYSQIALQDALRDYWARTPFDNYSVTDQTTEIVSSGEVLDSVDTQTEWTDFLQDIPDDVPMRVDNGRLELLQTCWTVEAENADVSGQTVTFQDYSGGEAAAFFDTGDDIEVVIDPNYDIPDGSLGIQLRYRVGTTGEPDYTVNVDGTETGSRAAGGGSTTLEWRSESTAGAGELTAGQHTIALTPEDVGGDGFDAGDMEVDVVAVYDTRFSYFFDNEVDGINGYLDGPELYPPSSEVVSELYDTQFNIKTLTADLTIDDTTNNQETDLSNDGGSNFTTVANDATPSVTFSDPGRTAQIRLQLSRYGSRDNATPKTGYLGQEIDALELTADLDDLVVIDELVLTNSHFENLQQLHEYGNFLWTIEHDGDLLQDLVVNSYPEGEETRPTPSAYDDPIDKTSSVNTENYYNAIYLRGATRDDGTYPIATVEEDGPLDDAEKIEATLKDPKITTQGGANFRAQSLLNELTDENNRRGQITIPVRATVTHPGYARSIDFGDGSELKTIEEVELSELQSEVSQTHNYEPPDNIDEKLAQLKRNARDTRDRL